MDATLAGFPPALLALESFLLMRNSDAFEATLDGVAMMFVLVPWVALLPAVVGFWLYRTGLPSPGQFVAGVKPTGRKGGILVDVLLILASLFASIPLFYVSEAIPNRAVVAVLMLAAPAGMTIGTWISFRWTVPVGRAVV